MPTQVLICDDSSFARKQMARALPKGWAVNVHFAGDGEEGLAGLKEGKGDILFLDLNMPVMDGYGVLEAIREQDLPTLVIVVSGDVQPEARRRVMELGAIAFIKKPVDEREVSEILVTYGLRGETRAETPRPDFEVDVRDGYQEIANVAMGRAADLLARLLGAFVVMPVPNVNRIEVSELLMALGQVGDGEAVSAVCQGFIGAGIAGEALLIFNESSFSDIADLMRYEGEMDDAVELELLMDIGSILIGACLKGIADQLDIHFSQGHPAVLGRHTRVEDIVKRNAARWKRTLAIEMGYTVENRNVNCDLLLLFTEDSVDSLDKLVSYLSD